MTRTTVILSFMLMFGTLALESQSLCDGNLGVNVFEGGDFGSGTSNNVQMDPGIAPGYLYSNENRSPRDGEYTLTNNTAEWGFLYPSWLGIRDNSLDPDGYMMVVNANFEPGLFYEQEVEGLCENTLYEFSADVLNIVKFDILDHMLPNIDFLIDDVVRFSTGNVAQDEQWKTYGFTLTTSPGQTSVKLSLRNNAPGGNGNDLALDNISFRACGPDAFVDADETIFLCEKDNLPTEIRAEVNATNQAIQWQFSPDSLTWTNIDGETSESYFHQQYAAGKYYYRYLTAGTADQLENDKCSVISDVLVLEVLPLEYLVKDTICDGQSLVFGSQLLSAPGIYNQDFTSMQGSCDSMVELDLHVIVNEPLNLDLGLIDPTCYEGTNGSITISVIDGPFEPYSYDVDAATFIGNTAEGLSAGNHLVSVTDNQGCIEEFLVILDQPNEFLIQLPNDTTIVLGNDMEIFVLPNEVITSLQWNPVDVSPCGDCETFNYLPTITQTITAVATNEKNCEATNAFTITMDFENLKLYVPNVFSTGTPGLDRTFSMGFKEGLVRNINEFSVYDRWGNLVHRIKDAASTELWDGRTGKGEVNPGVYVYLLKLELLDGNEYHYSGSVTVLR